MKQITRRQIVNRQTGERQMMQQQTAGGQRGGLLKRLHGTRNRALLLLMLGILVIGFPGCSNMIEFLEGVEVHFETGGGSTVESVHVVGYVPEPETDPTRAGYTFAGWYADAGFSTVWDFTDQQAREDMTLYAKWTANTYTVTLDRQSGSGGSAEVTATYAAAMPTDAVTAPTRDGYTFGGYYDAAGGSGTQYYTAAMASAAAWDKAADTTLYAKWTELAVGDPGPAGGYVFYDDVVGYDFNNDETISSDEKDLLDGHNDGTVSGDRYLEAAPYGWYNGGNDQGFPWGGTGTDTEAHALELGQGETNTALIVSILGQSEPYEGRSDYAAKICQDADINGYTDWFLPSRNELWVMYWHLHNEGIGGFNSSAYWSSCEVHNSGAYSVLFGSGPLHNNKEYEYNVRPIRAF